MDTFDLRKYLAEGQLHENEMDQLGDELAAAIEDKLEDKKGELKEIVDPISILSYVLAGTTLTNIIAKYAAKLFKKYNFGKGEKAAEKIYNFTSKLEEDFKSPIARVVGLFTKSEKAKILVTDALFILLLLTLGGMAGGEALAALKKGKLSKAGLSALKAGLKGKDIATVSQEIGQVAATL